MFWKFSDSFSPVKPTPWVNLVGSVFCWRTSTTSWLSLWYALCSHAPRGSMIMRTRSPLWNDVTDCTGVPKSATSSRRRKPSDKLDLRNSTTSDCPCCLMSTPTWLFGRSTITRPAPSAPRRKSMSFIGRTSWLRFSAKTTAVEAAGAATATGSNVTSRLLPRNSVL